MIVPMLQAALAEIGEGKPIRVRLQGGFELTGHWKIWRTDPVYHPPTSGLYVLRIDGTFVDPAAVISVGEI